MSPMPALTGDVVTERHARMCREEGHAVHTVDGVEQSLCPRCGEPRSSQDAAVATLARRTRVLSYCPDLGVGVVEGRSYLGRATAAVVRWANGTVGAWDDDMLVAVEAGTVLAEDEGNNVGRLCNVRGDGAAGERARCWRVVAALSGRRYLVEHQDTSAVRVVGHRDMTNLY